MMQHDVVVHSAHQVLAHVPGMARHGSKPARSLKDADLTRRFLEGLRRFEDAVAYLPHQAFIGEVHPRDLPERPWAGRRDGTAQRFGPFGEIMPEHEFLGLLAVVDDFELVALSDDAAAAALDALPRHPLAKRLDLDRIEQARGRRHGGIELYLGAERRAGAVRGEHEEDESLTPSVLLDNLAAKATATLALMHLLESNDVDPASIDYVIGCGEEAVGDRYQRGGGNIAKAIAQAAGLPNASGADVKNFCAAPIPALVVAASLVAAGVFERIAVVAGGSVAKLGMKFEGQLKNGLPVLEDVLGGAAALVERGHGPGRIRLDSVGRHTVDAGGSTQTIMEALAVRPLKQLGVPMTDIDDYATELHNPEITEPQGSGNVPERNYKTIAALAVRNGDITRQDLADFVARRGMPGFAPTQGHIASALCYLPHALRRLDSGEASRVMMIAKGSLFLGRMCQLSDGMSVLVDGGEEVES